MRVAVLALLTTLTSCGGDSDLSPTQPQTPRATSITLSPPNVSLTALGETAQVTATVKDQNGATMANQAVAWSSSATGVATVSAAGLVTAVGNGSAAITASSGTASAQATVTVAIPPFSLAANGVTVVCPTAEVGEVGIVGFLELLAISFRRDLVQ